MPFKNYYKTLGISPDASHAEIKKSFRKLALQYHPDRNQGNELANLQFREVQEAYEILSNPSKRSGYHYEWKLHFPKADVSYAYQNSPESILNECRKFQQQVAEMDIFRMNRESVYTRIRNILSEENMALLLLQKKSAINYEIVKIIIHISSKLQYDQVKRIASQLTLLAEGDYSLSEDIKIYLQESKKNNYWQQYYPLVVLLITLTICGFIYFLSHK